MADGRVELHRGERVIAEGAPADPSGDVPSPVSFAVAADAAAHYRWATGHPFPGCFVCGPDRDQGDGLRIFPGAVGSGRVAGAWVPDASVCDASGHAVEEVVWAALDCPSWFGILEATPDAGRALLGQLTARLIRRPQAGERCVVIGWSRGRDGRKLYGGAALFGDDGTLIGSSEAVWIALRDDWNAAAITGGGHA
jgi:hypothetical protein